MRLALFEPGLAAENINWRAFLSFAAYRLLLATMLYVANKFDLPPDFLGETNQTLYAVTNEFYLLVAVTFLVAAANKWGDFESQVKLQLTIDIIVLIGIMHSSGGISSGLGALQVIVVMAGAILIPGRSAAYLVAFATLAILFESSLAQLNGEAAKYSQAGMLGGVFFLTAMLAHYTALKMKESQMLAERSAEDAANLAALNEKIISNMQTGVLVLNRFGTITQYNQSSLSLLGITERFDNPSLKDFSTELAEQFAAWKRNEATAFKPFQASKEKPELLARATALDSGETLLYIDNATQLAQQVQQLKLASLGRLTASIAHEIRNPLSAISHAGELLAEINHEDAQTQKLTSIIDRHNVRVNKIIETILEMSRRKTAQPSVLVLLPWLETFIAEFCDIKQLDSNDIALVSHSPLAKIYVDQQQLHQVLSNLMDNAWHFSQIEGEPPRVRLMVTQLDDEVFIEVSDNGLGIPKKSQRFLFEPFHSERAGGTGLGLYLARALCEANGASLRYLDDVEQRCCFRITFPAGLKENMQ
jgi:two-component system sensor histidine kinase PilS (NtrC family)